MSSIYQITDETSPYLAALLLIRNRIQELLAPKEKEESEDSNKEKDLPWTSILGEGLSSRFERSLYTRKLNRAA